MESTSQPFLYIEIYDAAEVVALTVFDCGQPGADIFRWHAPPRVAKVVFRTEFVSIPPTLVQWSEAVRQCGRAGIANRSFLLPNSL
jgi:hypothetical protein